MVLFLAGLMLAFALALTACTIMLGSDSDNSNNGNGISDGNGDDTTKTEPAAVTKASLESAIAAAEAEKALVTVSVDGSDVAGGKDWVTQGVMDAFTAAIAAAKAVKDSGTATQAEVDAALAALNAARTTFKDTKAPGNKTSGFTVAELVELVTAANSVKAGVETSVDGSDKPPSVQWVTAAVMNALNTAITDAEAITEASPQSDKDARYTALNTAKNDFAAAKSPGTKAVALSGKTYFGYDTKIVFSVTSTSSGTFTAWYPLEDDAGEYILTGGKYTYELRATGTYTVNEGASTVTGTPTEMWYENLYGIGALVNEAEYRTRLQAYMDWVKQQPGGQEALDAMLQAEGFSSVDDYINYYVAQAFAPILMNYSFSNDGAALFLDGGDTGSLPPGVVLNELSGKTLTRINYSGTPQTVEFTDSTYTIKAAGYTVEYGEYSLWSSNENLLGFKPVSLKALTRNGKNSKAAYYDSLPYSDPGYYDDVSARKAGETNSIFDGYEAGYKLGVGSNEGEIHLPSWN
jgi:hypothetical protein